MSKLLKPDKPIKVKKKQYTVDEISLEIYTAYAETTEGVDWFSTGDEETTKEKIKDKHPDAIV